MMAVVVLQIVQKPFVAAQSGGIDYSNQKPLPVCIPEGQRCYKLTSTELINRFDNCCNATNGKPLSCKGGSIWWSTCQQVTGDFPPSDPKGPDHGLISVSAAYTGNENCTGIMNLGPSLSKSTCFTGEFPLLRAPPNWPNPVGREHEIGFLVGGNYTAPIAAEIEGNIVILGDFKVVGYAGTNSLGM